MATSSDADASAVTDNGSRFYGEIDEAMVFNRGLTDPEAKGERRTRPYLRFGSSDGTVCARQRSSTCSRCGAQCPRIDKAHQSASVFSEAKCCSISIYSVYYYLKVGLP